MLLGFTAPNVTHFSFADSAECLAFAPGSFVYSAGITGQRSSFRMFFWPAVYENLIWFHTPICGFNHRQ